MKKADITGSLHMFSVESLSSLEDSCFLLRAISNPTRLAILRSLKTLKSAQYTRLALSVGLDPAKESGNFNYHIGYLRRLGLVRLEGLSYALTDLGRKVASFVDSIATEFILAFSQTMKKNEGEKVFKIKELEEGDLRQLVLLKYGVLKEETEGVIHDYMQSERIWVYGKESAMGEEGAKNRSLIALDGENIAGAVYGAKGITGPIPPSTRAYEKVKEGQVLLHMLTKKLEERWCVPTGKIYDTWIDLTYQETDLMKILIRSFIDRVKDEGCREVWGYEIRSVRKDLLKALKEEGFRKTDTYYILRKTLRQSH